MVQIRVRQFRALHRLRFPVASLPRRVGDDRLHLSLDPLGKLLAPPGEHLDSVVFEGIVRRGDHHTCVVSRRTREIGDGGRRHDADARHRRTFSACAVGQLGLDPRARFARVAADQEPRQLGRMRQRPNQCRSQPADSGGIERRLAGDAADAVGSKKSRRSGISLRHWSPGHGPSPARCA